MLIVGACLRGARTIDKVDQTMAEIQEQTQLANEVSEAISTNTYAGYEVDDVRNPPLRLA